MKKYLNIILVAVTVFLCGASAKAQFYGVNLEPICWETTGGVDSSIYVAWLDAAATTQPSKLHYFNVSGLAVTVSSGRLRPGHCDSPQNDSINIRLDSIIVTLNIKLDSLLTNTHEPQVCDCIYTLDVDNHNFTIADNEQYPVWSYQRFVTMDCGAGAQEIFRQAGSYKATGTEKAHAFIETEGGNFLQAGGYLDSVRVFAVNPSEAFYVYLSPAKVFSAYPNLILSGLDTADLRFYTASVADMETALEAVMTYAVGNWAATHSPTLSTPSMDFEAIVLASGKATLRWHVTNNPSGAYINMNPAAASRKLVYHKNIATPLTNNFNSGNGGIALARTFSYETPCGTINTSYSAALTDGVSLYYYTLPLQDPATPTLGIGPGTETCEQACPEMGGVCIDICNTEDNPVPVSIVEDTCLTRNIFAPIPTTSSPVSLAANTYHSISIKVKTGTVTITYSNLGTPVTDTYTSGDEIYLEAKECQLIQSGLSVNLSAGTAKILVGQ